MLIFALPYHIGKPKQESAMSTQTIGPSVKRLREKSGISLSRLAEQSGLSLAYVSKLEDGQYQSPSLKTCRALSVGLGMTLRDFLEKIGMFDNSHNNTNGPQLIGSALRSDGYNEEQVRMILAYADYLKTNTKRKHK